LMPGPSVVIEAPLLTVKLHSVSKLLWAGLFSPLMTTWSPLHPLAQAALFAKKKLTPNVTANVSALSPDTRAVR
jgi:hypothetical protein